MTDRVNKGTKDKIRRFAGGFTLIEVIIVISFVGILAAVAAPSMIGFIEYGKQLNRMNIARTLYLAVQSQLNGLEGEGTPDTAETARFFEYDGAGLPANEADSIRYISKPSGYVLGDGGDDSPVDVFYRLLDRVIIDKHILDGAVLMEYNASTGAVLSLFYGEKNQMEFLPDLFGGRDGFAFTYDTDAAENLQVTGARGMGENGYQDTAARRKQGYYGVDNTGSPGLTTLSYMDIANIYDGFVSEKPLDIGSGKLKNVLYAEFLLVEPFGSLYNFEIVNHADDDKIIFGVYNVNISDITAGNFYTAVNDGTADHIIYKTDYASEELSRYGADASKFYHKYIWVIDYIHGDIVNGGQPHSIGEKYMRYSNNNDYENNETDVNVTQPQFVRVKITKSGGGSVTSITEAHTHFAGEFPNSADRFTNGVERGVTFEITSARHLNNIRYAPWGDYRQTRHINLVPEGDEVNQIFNFTPIHETGEIAGNRAFTGSYYAMKDIDSAFNIENISDMYPNAALITRFGEDDGDSLEE